MNKEDLIATEERIKKHWEDGDIAHLTHLCGGNELWLLDYYENNVDCEKDWVLCSHRTHYHALLFGITPDELVNKVLDGKSMFIYKERFLCSAIVAGVCSIACGIALAIQNRGGKENVHCFCGDGATDQGAFWEAVRFAEARDLPLTFIVEDNGAQCGVHMETRWGDGISSSELLDSVFLHNTKVVYYHYKPTHPHAGTCFADGKPTRPNLKWKG